jgi:HK97 gp10 family phage protein
MAVTVNVRQELDYTAINHQLYSANGGYARDMLRRGVRVQARARRNAPSKTGRLRTSIEVASVPRVVAGVTTFAIVVGTDLEYAKWVHDGTGVYGPRHTPIRPKTGSVLVFEGRRLGVQLKKGGKGPRIVVVREVAGQKARPFLKDALKAVRGRY